MSTHFDVILLSLSKSVDSLLSLELLTSYSSHGLIWIGAVCLFQLMQNKSIYIPQNTKKGSRLSVTYELMYIICRPRMQTIQSIILTCSTFRHHVAFNSGQTTLLELYLLTVCAGVLIEIMILYVTVYEDCNRPFTNRLWN